MGIGAATGIGASGLPPTNDQANAVVSGSFSAVGVSGPFAFVGWVNQTLYASYNTTLTVTAGSTSASVASAGAIAAGAAIQSAYVPAGTTVGAITGTTVTLAIPPITLYGNLQSNGLLGGLASTDGVLGATVYGPGLPTSGATVTSIAQAAVRYTSGTKRNIPGIVILSYTSAPAQTLTTPQAFVFARTGAAILTSGADTAAIFTGATITWTGSVQRERSFDGGSTWVVDSVDNKGTMAVFTGLPVSVRFVESERSVLYRLNCTAVTTGGGIVVNYRFSETGGAAMALQTGNSI